MVGASSWSSSSSCTLSLGSFDDDVVAVACVVKPADAAAAAEGSVKFLCSYGGKILPRHADGTLRYVGGDNRVVSVDRALPFYELQRKLREMCGWEAVCLRCQLPTEDLDALVSVTSDDDLANLLEEYDAASRDRLQSLKIRAFLFPRTTTTTPPPPLSRSPPPSIPSSSSVSRMVPHAHYHHQTRSAPPCASRSAAHQMSPLARVVHQQHHYSRHGGEMLPHRYLVHSDSHW
ncbi:hypothetical protein E2562_000202 [Oryza meyeriana var. granulata]|uniref:PB1 domain-containing protein n=1 Tax=Oryza meyeriana var. granulata TaxID=110450 RepID=A0A6G1DC74_9ORYZ|nr:hypothetical protein E2562_000202 [Oryza meyeriana var. granulata]